MYDPAVMGNKSPLVKDDFFFFLFFFSSSAPQNVTICILLCCVYITGSKIYAKGVRWCQVFLARSWESCQLRLVLINGKRAARWLHLSWRVLLTPCQAAFNYWKFVFFMLYELQYLSCWHSFDWALRNLKAADTFLLSLNWEKLSSTSLSAVEF